ncbi:helix-turn-helix domain-containing protein [Paraburkholderia panacisoli]|uniref:Helix-turn-helix domain-containing protein n=1 Tax=Paraburkholderia panacisoli TaxID=2603818 RepID=A0A5B0GQ73_9BURK|nr:helix-turn-helix domain-containing protein [Paraburkholderia panacisoli]KAA1004289.1 helix-turn-helix domain-containing protein [Paraburkholderia panacisoli]
MLTVVKHSNDASCRTRASCPAFANAAAVTKEASARYSECAMGAICKRQDLRPPEFASSSSVVCVTRTVKGGATLYRAGDTFHSIYTICAGSFKTVVMHRDGVGQITGFQLAGETLGLDGVFAEQHSCDAIALEDSLVCIIPFDLLELLCREVKAMQHHVHRMMSGEIVRESGLMMLLGTMSAEQRVAAFLINLSQRLNARGYSAAEFNLRMTRDEIGSYLGIKLETVSRMLSKLQKEGLVDTRGKRIRILDLDSLTRL